MPDNSHFMFNRLINVSKRVKFFSLDMLSCKIKKKKGLKFHSNEKM